MGCRPDEFHLVDAHCAFWCCQRTSSTIMIIKSLIICTNTYQFQRTVDLGLSRDTSVGGCHYCNNRSVECNFFSANQREEGNCPDVLRWALPRRALPRLVQVGWGRALGSHTSTYVNGCVLIKPANQQGWYHVKLLCSVTQGGRRFKYKYV